jgi:peptide-methionine (R)-S-oxide reductase
MYSLNDKDKNESTKFNPCELIFSEIVLFILRANDCKLNMVKYISRYTKIFALLLLSNGCTSQTKNKNMEQEKKHIHYSKTDSAKLNLPDEEWKKVLTAEQYYIARQKGTERPWTSRFESFHEVGTYHCAACGNPLFQSDTKFESGCGWPSFYKPVSKGSIIYTPDNSHGMQRTEVQCGRCKAHLGHVFEDGPPPTGLRYCINGVILDFEKKEHQ